MKFFSSLFAVNKDSKATFGRLRENLSQAVQKAAVQHRKLVQSYNLIHETLHAAGGIIWRKDANGRYLFANAAHCRTFLMPDRCHEIQSHLQGTESAQGFTDQELIRAYIARTGSQHTFMDSAETIDNYVKDTGEQCNFLALGMVGAKPMALHLIETPVYENDRYAGLVGFGFDLAAMGGSMLLLSQEYIDQGNAKELGKGLYLLDLHGRESELRGEGTMTHKELPL